MAECTAASIDVDGCSATMFATCCLTTFKVAHALTKDAGAHMSEEAVSAAVVTYVDVCAGVVSSVSSDICSIWTCFGICMRGMSHSAVCPVGARQNGHALLHVSAVWPAM